MLAGYYLRRFFNLAVLFLMMLTPGTPALSLVVTEVIAVAGDPSPDGNGVFESFRDPVINNAGQVAFKAELAGTSGGDSDDTGIFRGDMSSLSQIAREGQATPDGNGNFGTLMPDGSGSNTFDTATGYPPSLNDAGQVAFYVGINSSDQPDDRGLYRSDGVVLTTIARVGQTAPGSQATILGTGIFISLNESGEVGFTGVYELDQTSVSGIFRSEGSTFTELVRRGETTSDGEVAIPSWNHALLLNNQGQVSFGNRREGMFFGDENHIAALAIVGQPLPDGIGTYKHFLGFDSNNQGQTAFVARVESDRSFVVTPDGFPVFIDDDLAIVLTDGDSQVTLARTGYPTPNGDFYFTYFLSGLIPPAINDAGQVAFRAFAHPVGVELADRFGIFTSDGTTTQQIVDTAHSTPDGESAFDLFSDPAINSQGQVTFGAVTVDSIDETERYGIYLHDPTTGLVQLAQEGDALLDSVITDIRHIKSLSDMIGAYSDLDQFNDLGQATFRFTLADGRQGIAISQVVPDIPGDYNFDGAVDAADFTLWRDSLGQSGEGLAADGDGSGTIDEGDFLVWRNHFGESALAQAGSQLRMVPEPSTLLLAVLGCFSLRRRAAAPSR